MKKLVTTISPMMIKILAEDVDHSLGKTRSATKRANRASPSQDPGTLIRSGAPVVRSASAVPATLAMDTAPAASVTQISALQRGSEASHDNSDR